MPLPQLGADVEVTRKQGPEGAFFVLQRKPGGQPVVLSEPKYRVVELLGQADSYQALVETLRAGGQVITVAAAEVVVDELRAHELLVEASASAPVPSTPPTGRPIPTYPRLLKNLDIQPVPDSPRPLFQVRAPGSPKMGMLSDVDLTLAGLMDGTRDLDALVEAARAAGVPASLEQLSKFIRELQAYDVLENAAAKPAKVVGFGSDSPVEGAGAVEEAPAVPWTERLRVTAAPIAESALAWGRTTWARASQLRGRELGVAIGGAALLLVSTVGLVVHVPLRVRTKCVVSALKQTPVTAASERTLVELTAASGQPVKAGEVVGKLDASDLTARAEEVNAELEKLDAKLAVLRSPASRGQLASVKKKLAAAKKQLAKAKRKGGASNSSKAAVEALQARLKLLQQAGNDDAIAAVQAQARTLHIELADLKQAQAAAVLTAPVDGVLVGAGEQVKPGQQVHAGEVLLAVGDPGSLGTRVQLEEDALPKLGDHVEVRAAKGAPWTGHVTAVEKTPKATVVEVVLDESADAKPGAAAEATFTLGRQTLLGSLFHSEI